MSYPTTERLKNLEESVRQMADQFAVGHSIEDKVFHGVVTDTYHDSEFSEGYLIVAPLDPYSPPQTGNIHFLNMGDDPSEDLPDNIRTDKVFVLNLPNLAVDAYYSAGDIITYWHYSGTQGNTQKIRGSYVTYWCDQGQKIVHITSTTTGSGVYNGKRMSGVGTVGSKSSPDNLNMPPIEALMASSEDCLVINLAENQTTGSHWIPNDTWTIGLQCAVTDYEIATDETPVVAVYIPQPISYCKISYDFSDAFENNSCVYGVTCNKDGSNAGSTQYLFALTGHQTQLQGYCNLMAGDIVRYFPYPVVAPAAGAVIGMIAHLPIVASQNLYAVLQTTVASVSGSLGGRVGFDWVRSHS